MKKTITLSLLAIATAAVAQDTYQSAVLTEKDLNGTARYVGMGGAMEALGADISTMGTNPAGIGLFRKSQGTLTFGTQSVTGNDAMYYNPTKTKLSFDQAGFVMTVPTSEVSFLNFGFNYHKSRNFNSILSTSGSLRNASQNKLSYIKDKLGVFANENTYSQVDDLYDYVLNGIVGEDGKMKEHFAEYYHANGYDMQQVEEGYAGAYDFNVSGNLNNRVYLGLTVGIEDIHYKSYSIYSETLLATDDRTPLGDIMIDDFRHITGTGFNIKAGAIIRPVETSPFRIGAYIHTPTWYSLTTSNYTTMYNNLPKEYGNYDKMTDQETLDFKLNTPWLFGVSLGHTVGQDFAFGATYEYSDYSNLDNRYIDGGYYDYYGSYCESSSSDVAMNRNTEETLKGVHTIKVGAEAKITPQVAVRVGYNYVSPKYSTDGYKDVSINSQGVYSSSRTDYINWQGINRVTAGFGYAAGKFSADFAIKYTTTKGEYYPFMSFYADAENRHMDNICDMRSVKDERLQCMLTLGYRF